MTEAILRWRLTRSELRSEAGLSLVELMITMSIMLVVVASILGVLFSVQQGVNREIKMVDTLDQARLAVQSMDHELRSATAWTVTNSGMGLSAFTMTGTVSRGNNTDPGTPASHCVDWRLVTDTSAANYGQLLWRTFPASALGTTTVYPYAIKASDVLNANPTGGAPAVPFVITVDSEQMRVTARAGSANPYTYTVVRGYNSTTAAVHSGGTPVTGAHFVGSLNADITAAATSIGVNQYPVFSIPLDTSFGGRMMNVAILTNTNPQSANNGGGQGRDTMIQTSVSGRNITAGANNPCTTGAPPSA